MKAIVLIIFFIFFVGVLSMIIMHFFTERQILKDERRRSNRHAKNVRNFKVRFDAAKEKYYIVNQLETYDEPVTNCFGFRVFYKDKPKAEFVAEKLNS